MNKTKFTLLLFLLYITYTNAVCLSYTGQGTEFLLDDSTGYLALDEWDCTDFDVVNRGGGVAFRKSGTQEFLMMENCRQNPGINNCNLSIKRSNSPTIWQRPNNPNRRGFQCLHTRLSNRWWFFFRFRTYDAIRFDSSPNVSFNLCNWKFTNKKTKIKTVPRVSEKIFTEEKSINTLERNTRIERRGYRCGITRTNGASTYTYKTSVTTGVTVRNTRQWNIDSEFSVGVMKFFKIGLSGGYQSAVEESWTNERSDEESWVIPARHRYRLCQYEIDGFNPRPGFINVKLNAFSMQTSPMKSFDEEKTQDFSLDADEEDLVAKITEAIIEKKNRRECIIGCLRRHMTVSQALQVIVRCGVDKLCYVQRAGVGAWNCISECL